MRIETEGAGFYETHSAESALDQTPSIHTPERFVDIEEPSHASIKKCFDAVADIERQSDDSMNELAEGSFLKPETVQKILIEDALSKGNISTKDESFARSLIEYFEEVESRTQKEDEFYKTHLGSDKYWKLKNRKLAAQLVSMAKDHLFSSEKVCPRQARRTRAKLQEIFKEEHRGLIERHHQASEKYEQASQNAAEYLNRTLDNESKKEILGSETREINSAIVRHLEPRYNDKLNKIVLETKNDLKKEKDAFDAADTLLHDTKKAFKKAVIAAATKDLAFIQAALAECKSSHQKEYEHSVDVGSRHLRHANTIRDERFEKFMGKFKEHFQMSDRATLGGTQPIDATFGSEASLKYLEKNLFN